jgi:hypothetical protein
LLSWAVAKRWPDIIDVFTDRYEATYVSSRERCITTVLHATIRFFRLSYYVPAYPPGSCWDQYVLLRTSLANIQPVLLKLLMQYFFAVSVDISTVTPFTV